MITYEDVSDMPQRDNGTGLWIKAAPLPAPFIRRARDAWQVLRGRAEAVRESSNRELEARFLRGYDR